MGIDLVSLAKEIHRLSKTHRIPPPGATRLVKLIYLADLDWRRSHSGEPLSSLNWRFLHFGPHGVEFAPLLGSEDAEIVEQKNGKAFTRLHFSEEDLQEPSTPREVSCVLDKLINEWGDADLNLLLDHVYFDTEPMMNAKRGDALDFSHLNAPAAPVKPKLDESKLRSLREKLRQRTAALALCREPLKVSLAGTDTDAAWNEEFKPSTLPSGIEFKISDL